MFLVFFSKFKIVDLIYNINCSLAVIYTISCVHGISITTGHIYTTFNLNVHLIGPLVVLHVLYSNRTATFEMMAI